jgi:hypothetical protein
MGYLALHNAIVNCKKPLLQPENGMDTKDLLNEAKKIWEEQYGKGLEGTHRRRQIGNTQPYDADDFAEFEKAYYTALEVLGKECGYEASAPSATTQTKNKAEQIQAIIKGLEITLKRAKNEADKKKTEAIIKGLQISLKRAK